MLSKAIFLGAALSFGSLSYANVDFSKMNTPHVSGEMIITFEEGVSLEEQEAILAQSGAVIIKSFKSSNAVLARVSSEENTLYTANIFSMSGAVKSTGLNRIFTINSVPSDPSYSSQYQYDLIGAEAAWEITTGSKDVVVGIIDTGIVYDHPDLIDNMWQNEGELGLDSNGNDKRSNGIDDDNNGYIDDFRGWDFAEDDNDPMDDHGHGTHCAGSIGASANNGEGIAGLNWNVSLVPLRFITAKGQGTEADAIEAIEYATMMGFDMTSNSWGGSAIEGDEDALFNAIKAAADADKLFIAASGNDGRDNDSRPIYPASYELENIISVAASDNRDTMTGFSNYGADSVDLLAPGANIYSTIKKGWFGNQYGKMSGTSMAAPIVAAAAALIKSEYPKESAVEIKERILKGVDVIRAGKGKLTTEGRLNVYKSLTL